MSLPAGVEIRSFDGADALATRGDPIGDEPTNGPWRRWDPHRSKLGAMLEMGLDVGLTGGETVLYLGAANGTTVSHVADFCGPTYAVEFAPRPMRDLIAVAEPRSNLIPLLEDARDPVSYAHVVEVDVDAVIQDVATRGQARVARENARFLAPDGRLICALKARSEDVAADPDDVFDRALDDLRDPFEVLETARLDRYHADHLAVIGRPRS